MLPLVGLTTERGAGLRTGILAAVLSPAHAAGGAARSLGGSVAGAVGLAMTTHSHDGVWSRPGRVHVPVAEDRAEVTVAAALALDGVSWAGVDPAGGRLVVDYDEAL